MISKPRSLRVHRNPIGLLILLAAFAAAAGCSTANTTGGDVVVNHVDASGNSVPGWLTPTGGLHAKSATLDYIANGGSSSCTECHGSDLAGGISRVSCFGNTAGCHHGGPVAGWVATPPAAQPHGLSAKKAPGSSGFASCRICHGNDFAGNTSAPSCLNNASCHGAGVVSPHPFPWRVANGSDYDHNTTNTANAPVCYGCHADSPAGNPNNPHRPPTPAAAGTPPGCFNGTMCHNAAAAPHITGSTWLNAGTGFHGTDAKSDLTNCQGCHGTPGTINFNGGSAPTACSTCHTASKAHPTDWQGFRTINGVTITHRTSGNRGVACAICHNTTGPGTGPNPSAPSCFSASFTNSLGQARSCHSGGPGSAPHAVPYNDDSHYTVTSATFPGNCSACHDVSAPSTKSGPVCQTCHVAASPLTSLNCTSCHASPPSGAAYPNIAGAHSTHVALDNTGSPVSCGTCHDGLGPSLLNLNHYNRAKSRVSPGDAAFPATYDAKTGASSFDNSAALSCSNVSCHGGQATPNWQTGALDVNTQCTNCHALGTTQYNSYDSGEHPFHVEKGVLCVWCHNTTALAVNHFTTLADNTISPAVASATVGGAGTLITTWTPGSGTSGTCNAACHPGDRDW